MRSRFPLILIATFQMTVVPAQAGILSKLIDKLTGRGVYSSFQELSVDESMQEFVKSINSKNVGFFKSDPNPLRTSTFAQAEKVSFINNDNHTQIVSEYRVDGLYLTFQYDEIAVKNPELMLKDLNVFTVLTRFHEVNNISSHRPFLATVLESPHSWVETQRNALDGSVISKSRLQDIELELLRSNVSLVNTEFINALTKDSSTAKSRLPLEIEIAEKKSAELRLQAQVQAKKQQKALDKLRDESGTLKNFESMDEKLNDLILKNDRAGVARMLEAYLPWSVMEPGEIKAWKIWLQAIEFPDNSKMAVAFRGVDYSTDKVQRLTLPSGEERFGFMSTVLTKNQGSYSRRLRSLSTNRVKNGDVAADVLTDSVFVGKISDQMSAHAKNPSASSFISFTYSPSVATRFIGRDKSTVIDGNKVYKPGGGFLAVQMDSRRLFPNFPSMFGKEIELLAPLIIFPDEVVAFKESHFRNHEYEELMEKIAIKTGNDPKTWERMSDVPKIDIANYKRDGFAFFKELNERPLNAGSCSKVFVQ
ncbi:hypothetical protein [Bdellovibrio sp. HCB209]|uniref:hypothetical protein n=1 Tax=Bdellovibrio sp. HCB209 TaxID=3394354 RepID=UPI0039B3E6AB